MQEQEKSTSDVQKRDVLTERAGNDGQYDEPAPALCHRSESAEGDERRRDRLRVKLPQVRTYDSGRHEPEQGNDGTQPRVDADLASEDVEDWRDERECDRLQDE